MMGRTLVQVLIVVLSGLAVVAHATTPQDVKTRVGIEPHVGAELPLAVMLRDERGRDIRLADLVQRRPAILALVYFNCPNLCDITLNSLATSLSHIDQKAGRDFDVIALSIDPREQAKQAADRHRMLLEHHPDAAGWHFLTADAAAIAKVSDAVGYRFFWDASQNQFAHPAGITLITSDGRISRYFGGVQFPPPELRWALVEAGRQQVSSAADQLWLLCYHYGALIGRYSSQIMLSVRGLGLLIVVALATLLWRLSRKTP